MGRDEVLAILAAHRDEMMERGVESLRVFGSMARDEAGPDSDVDLLVTFTKPVGMFEFVRLKRRLEELLQRKVDLATPAALKRQLRDDVLKDAIRAT